VNQIKLVLVGIALLCGISGCENQQEADDLALAQKCLDDVPVGNPGAAEGCLQFVAKYESQQAQILKCAIYMTSGGMVETKIIRAYQVMKDNSVANKEAMYMSILSLNNPDANSGYTKAVLADRFCQASGVSGLKYISGVILAGSYMNRVIASLTANPLGVDLGTMTTNDINTAVQNMLADCTGATPNAMCTDDPATLGSTVTTLASSYCTSTKADQEVCAQMTATVTAAGGDASDVGRALFCLLKGENYNPTLDTCI